MISHNEGIIENSNERISTAETQRRVEKSLEEGFAVLGQFISSQTFSNPEIYREVKPLIEQSKTSLLESIEKDFSDTSVTGVQLEDIEQKYEEKIGELLLRSREILDDRMANKSEELMELLR